MIVDGLGELMSEISALICRHHPIEALSAASFW